MTFKKAPLLVATALTAIVCSSSVFAFGLHAQSKVLTKAGQVSHIEASRNSSTDFDTDVCPPAGSPGHDLCIQG